MQQLPDAVTRTQSMLVQASEFHSTGSRKNVATLCRKVLEQALGSVSQPLLPGHLAFVAEIAIKRGREHPSERRASPHRGPGNEREAKSTGKEG